MHKKLLLEIARCSQAQSCINNTLIDHPCSKIVHVQNSSSFDDYQVPEPWCGNIIDAPILFISSNPAISSKDIFPTGKWMDDDITDFFENRFGGGKQEWTRNGTKALDKNGTYMKATSFWASVRQRAIELLKREVNPGLDYALTEVVHCKSKQEIGVTEATEFCVNRYFNQILSLSGALVIVVLGKHARTAVQNKYKIANNLTMVGPIEFNGRKRIITFLPHPNARGSNTFAKCVPAAELEAMQIFLEEG